MPFLVIAICFARMVYNLGHSIGNVGTNICRCSSRKNIIEGKECEEKFPLSEAHVHNADLF